jgi:Arc/MetJ-type ribon-helix-helix transcriptional regulator
MGRPPLGNKSTHVRLPPELRARIEALVGKNRMGAFIREAVEEVISRREAGAGGKPRPHKPTKVRK